MKSYIRITALTAVLFLAGIILFIALTSGSVTQDTSRSTITAMNDIARTAEAHRSKLGAPSKLFDDYQGTDFLVLDMTDHVLYSHSAAEEELSVERLIQKRYPYQYLKDDSSVWGCVILLDDGLDGYRRLRYRFIIGMSIGGLLTLLGMIGFGVYLNRRIITPFRNVQQFAGRIAEGRLDEPLAMDRDNLFGAFSESFDIMRDELSASKQRELALQKKERELVASLSHDIKTPVTGIKLAAELLQMRFTVKAECADNEIVFGKDEIDRYPEHDNEVMITVQRKRLVGTDIGDSIVIKTRKQCGHCVQQIRRGNLHLARQRHRQSDPHAKGRQGAVPRTEGRQIRYDCMMESALWHIP